MNIKTLRLLFCYEKIGLSSAVTLTSKVLTTILAIVSFPILTHTYTLNQVGDWYIFLGLSPFFMIVEGTIGGAFVNKLSKAEDKLSAYSKLMIRTYFYSTLQASFIYFVIFLLISLISYHLFPDRISTLLYLCIFGCATILFSFIQILDKILIATGKIYRIQIADFLTALLQLISILICSKFYFGLYVFTAIYLSIFFAVKLINFCSFRQSIGKLTWKDFINYPHMKKWNEKHPLKDGLPFMVVILASSLGTSIDLLLLRLISDDPADVVFMAYLQRFFMLFAFVGTISLPLWPIFNKQISEGKVRDAMHGTMILALIYCASAIILSIMVLFVNSYFENRFLPENIKIPISILVIGLIARGCTLVGECFSPLMQGSLFIKKLGYIAIITCILSLSLKPFLIANYSLMGLNIANALIYGIIYSGLCYFFIKSTVAKNPLN
jgi:O-antigen/teichoic acid export membrane protein